MRNQFPLLKIVLLFNILCYCFVANCFKMLQKLFPNSHSFNVDVSHSCFPTTKIILFMQQLIINIHVLPLLSDLHTYIHILKTFLIVHQDPLLFLSCRFKIAGNFGFL